MPKVNSKLVDIEPGGESTQYVMLLKPLCSRRFSKLWTRYESIRTVTKSPPKQTGQLGCMSKLANFSSRVTADKTSPF